MLADLAQKSSINKYVFFSHNEIIFFQGDNSFGTCHRYFDDHQPIKSENFSKANVKQRSVIADDKKGNTVYNTLFLLEEVSLANAFQLSTYD